MATTKLPPDIPQTQPDYRGKDDAADAARYVIEDEFVTKYWDTVAGEYKYTTKPEKIPMSNKFLPFVVENSTPLHIFKTIMSRSKGMNQVLIASVFNLVLNVNIKELREKVKQLPEMDLEKIYEELMTKYPIYRVDGETLDTYQTIVKYFPQHSEMPSDMILWAQELKAYGEKDVMLFFCALVHSSLELDDYTSFPFKLLIQPETINVVLDDLPAHVMLHDQGKKVFFKNQTELRCFIIYHGLYRAMMEPGKEIEPYCLAFKNGTKK